MLFNSASSCNSAARFLRNFLCFVIDSRCEPDNLDYNIYLTYMPYMPSGHSFPPHLCHNWSTNYYQETCDDDNAAVVATVVDVVMTVIDNNV